MELEHINSNEMRSKSLYNQTMKQPLAPVILFAVLAGCSTAPPPLVDKRADALNQIKAAEEKAIRAFGKHDAGQSASMYASEAALMMTNMPLVKDRNIRPLLEEIMADPNFSMSFKTDKVEATKSGDLGYTRGTYTLTMTDPKSKKVLRESGKYLTVYAKQPDGDWKIVDDINNPDAPAVPVSAKK
jgi:ketosteroid isomerase-like protein